DLEDVVQAYRKYNGVTSELEDAQAMLDDDLDEEMLEMTKEEINDLNQQKEKLEEDMKVLLIPKDPNADKNVIMEIRAAAGGDEAALFAGDLYRMYSRFAENHGWKIEVIETHSTGVGGLKEMILTLNEPGPVSILKLDNGAHRVQRGPETESGGRIHTSTASVAVLPESEEVEVD